MGSGWAGWQDGDLARAALTDVDAFAELYRRHVNGVYRYLLARTGMVSAAEDLTAHTFEDALSHLAAFRGDGTFAGWLMTIARAAANDYYRQQYRADRIEQPLEDGDDPHDDMTLDEMVIARLELSAVSAALERLQPERAEAVRLRLVADLSTAETARLMGKTEAAVKMLLHRALSDLRRTLVVKDTRE